jgi:hypothetical protein
VLLAESTPLPPARLERVLHDPTDRKDWKRWLAPDLPMLANVDWDDFVLEYPWISGDAAGWKQRLVKAIAPTLAELALK